MHTSFLDRRSASGVAAALLVTISLLLIGLARAQVAEGAGTWTAKAPLPTARNEVVAVALDGKVYVLGGSLQGDRYDLARNDAYDPATDRWQERAPMPRGLNHQGAAALDGKIYTVGGFTGANHKGVDSAVFVYDSAHDSWQTLAPLSSARGSVSAAAVAGKIHAVGGRRNETDVVATHEVYDPAAKTWSMAAPLPKARDHLALVAADGKLHAIGGRFGRNEDMTGLHDVYDPATDSWTSAPPLPTPRGGGGNGTLYRGLILVAGGEDDKRTFSENEGFDLKQQRWIKLAPMPAGLHGEGAASVGDTAYFAAGSRTMGGRGTTNEFLAFRLP